MLKTWIPGTTDTRDQGLVATTWTNGGVTIADSGKLGKCLSSTGSSQVIYATNYTLSEKWSFSLWWKDNNTSAGWQYIVLLHNGTANDSNAQMAFLSYPNGNRCEVCSNGKWHSSISYTPGTWNHIAGTYDGTTCKCYLNGVLYGSFTPGQTKTSTNMRIMHSCNCYVNDLRIWDGDVISPREVAEIAKGLVLHYPLNRGGLGQSNLLKNGFGELGSENWSNSNIYTDVPSGQSEIKKSYRDNESLEFIPLLRNCTYKFSYWVKAADSSAYSYPSLKPYDADKLFISTNNCREGFNLSSMTALKKQLNPGDTKIYVDDLSAWNANSGHYYDTVAIFSYTDGQGYTWPDGIYTRNCPAFSSGTGAKTNLDKTNNIITLLSAYTGPTMPIGTKVCASTYGSTYFYPSGGINNSTIADWTYKEGVFSSQHSRLECAKYIRVYAYPSCYQAGMILSNLTLEDMDNNIEYDVSGYGNNGIRNGTFSWSGDTPRYGTSAVFSGNQYIVEPNEIITTDSTIALWVKSSLNGNAHVLDARNNSEIGKQPIYQYVNGAIQTGGNAGYVTSNSGLLVANTWVHVVLVQNGNSLLIYKNGDLFQTISCANSPVIKPTLGARLNFTNKYTGQLSDVRVYATPLTADQVKELYSTVASLSDNGTLFANEFIEM